MMSGMTLYQQLFRQLFLEIYFITIQQILKIKKQPFDFKITKKKQ